MVLETQYRPDLAAVKPFQVDLMGDETNDEIEQYIGLGTDKDTDKWFREKPRPTKADYENFVRRGYEQRADAAVGRTRFALYAPRSGRRTDG